MPRNGGSHPICVVAACALVLAGCRGPGGSIPTYEVGTEAGEKTGYHTVVRGETLYAIAFRYGLDYRALAAANGIEEPYMIHPDQRLQLEVAAVKPPAPEDPPKAKPPPSRPSARAPLPKKGQTAKIATPRQEGRPSWRWPVDGKVIKPFSLVGDLNKGIDIRGKMGQSVTAAADGIVVYAGGGLRGYGNLVIVKHTAKLLSAYGHNSRIVVEEGQRVEAGQKVAEVGSSGPSGDMLHFEIRRDGKPEDPLKYLPRRRGRK